METQTQESIMEDGMTFEQLLNESYAKDNVTEGAIVTGSILTVTKDFVIVDVGYKSEGMVPVNEFSAINGELQINVGDPIDVLVESRENEFGLMVLSKEKADRLKVWDEISDACERDEVVEGVVLSRVKGGLQVDIGVKAFLPGSQVDLRPMRNLDKLIGERFKFKVIKFNKKRGNIVLSRRALLEEERQSKRSTTLEILAEGAMMKGVVKNLTDYGAFIDLGGIDGLLHVSDMSWGRVQHPAENLRLAMMLM
jgi:small subunit ribosomal protein S1